MARQRRAEFVVCVLSLLLSGAAMVAAQVNPKLYQALRWRSIGPERGGRSTAVAGVAGDRMTYYMGGTGGGVWKTANGGITWTPVSDRYFKTGSVGAIAVAQSNADTVYVGMGEACLRSNISHGDGVYKSSDGGRSWQNVGLRDSSQIGRVYVDPQNPDLVYVAAVGHPYGANAERGVFRSGDGGKTWKKVLFVNEKTGAVDLSVDAHDRRTIYATTWQMLRTPWDINEVGPGSGIYKSTDGGDTWTQLKQGLPKSDMGKIGIAVSPVDGKRVYATVGGEEGGIYRSEDGGATWKLIDGSFEMHSRQYYYGHIFADPRNVDTVYTFSAKGFYKSTDAGKSWGQIRTAHGDYHDLWIDPNDNQRMINANDGGATVTYDGGRSWSTQMNQPTAQFYGVRTDNDFPYRVYGAQQDNTTVSIASTAGGPAGRGAGSDFTEVGGGESGYVVPDPKDPSVVYAGAYWGLLTRHDRRTGLTRNITVWPDYPGGRTGADQKYRFQWTFPIAVSTAEPGTVYVGGNAVFKSTNQGQSWTAISRDLTRNDPERTRGGRLEDIYGTVFTLAPSPRDRNVIWAGSDDGLVHLTRDGGKTWVNVTPPAVQAWTRISVIEASPHDPATAYVAANRYQLDDFRPYIYRTHDYGKTWAAAASGIAEDTFVRTVRQDPVRPQLLFAGTETGVYFSIDDGARWQSLQLNLPVVPVTDLVLKDGDVVISTQGRSFWILDNATVLEQATAEVEAAPMHLFQPRTAYRKHGGRGFGGRGPMDGVTVDYYLAAAATQPVTIEFLDAAGKSIKRFSSESRGAAAQPQRGGRGPAQPSRDVVGTEAGMNRFVWDMRYPDAEGIEGGTYLFGGSLRGPEAAPGRYQARLTAGGQTQTQAFEIRKDPRVPTTQEEYDRQVAFLLAVRDKLSTTHATINRLRQVQRQLQNVLQKAGGDAALNEEGQKLGADLAADLQMLYEARFTGFDDQTLVYPLRLNNRIAALQNYASGEFPPTEQAGQVFADLSAELERTLARVKQTDGRLASFNTRLKQRGLPEVAVAAASTGRD